MTAFLCQTPSLLADPTISIQDPEDEATFEHWDEIGTINGISSETNVPVVIKIYNTYVISGTQNTHIIGPKVVTTDPAGGQFSWTPQNSELYGFGGNATWKVEVWLQSDSNVKDTHEGDVNPPEPPA